ncbi:malonyl-coenzyme A:anthocyanin 3-O-glucoside-6''-O-malonyltransferase-like [Aristolochia californica]|uniref:malonyl-coenzyme A:anthocyanin 3-O-glucoside-6''-O-malonyltransferase-like n=1 Tax=Aristolochia californica TaxID=171875 RepID=UPI0035D6C663
MASAVDNVKVMERRRVSLSSDAVSLAEITLTYFDIALLPIPPIQQLFFYDFSGSTQDFRDSYFPLFEQSVSFSLTLFYPLDGRLIPLTDSYPGDHVIRYSDGDSVSLILAESGADFARLVGNEAKEAKEFHSLVPPLLLECSSVTVFPHSGISFGFTVKHSVADGSALTHFLKSLASIFKAGSDVSVVKNLPIHDRTLLRHLEQLKRNHMEQEAVKNAQTRTSLTESEPVEAQLKRIVRSTFVLTLAHIQKLCNKISATGGGREEDREGEERKTEREKKTFRGRKARGRKDEGRKTKRVRRREEKTELDKKNSGEKGREGEDSAR